MTDKTVIEFLRESNAIEGVFDDDSLKQAEKAWKYLIKQHVMTPEVILKTHNILMMHHLRKDQRGSFRYSQVWVGGHEAIHWSFIENAIDAWTRRSNLMVSFPGSRIENDIKNHHVEYEKIHPFVDGNGRTGRMFMNWERHQVSLPLLVIKNSEKQDYYKWFK